MVDPAFCIFSHLCLQEATLVPRALGARLEAVWLRLANLCADAAYSARSGQSPVIAPSGLAWSGAAPHLNGIDPDRMDPAWRAFLEGIAWGCKAFQGVDNHWLAAFWTSLCSMENPRKWLADHPGALLRMDELAFEIERQGFSSALAAHQSEDGLSRGLALGLSMARDPGACWELLPARARRAAAQPVDWVGWSLPWHASLVDRVRAETLRPFLPSGRYDLDAHAWRRSRLSSISSCLPSSESSVRACAGALADEAILAWLAPIQPEANRIWRQACLLAFPNDLGSFADELFEHGAQGASQALAEPFEAAEQRLLVAFLHVHSPPSDPFLEPVQTPPRSGRL